MNSNAKIKSTQSTLETKNETYVIKQAQEKFPPDQGYIDVNVHLQGSKG